MNKNETEIGDMKMNLNDHPVWKKFSENGTSKEEVTEQFGKLTQEEKIVANKLMKIVLEDMKTFLDNA